MGFKRKRTNKRNKKRGTKKYRGGMNAAVPTAAVPTAPADPKPEAKANLIQTVPGLKTALDKLDTFDPQTKDDFGPIDTAMGAVNEAILSYKGLFLV